MGDNIGTQSRGVEEKEIIEEVEDPSHGVVHCFGTEFSFGTLCCILDNLYLKFYLLKYFLLFEEWSFEVFVIIIGWISGIYIYQNKNKKINCPFQNFNMSFLKLDTSFRICSTK